MRWGIGAGAAFVFMVASVIHGMSSLTSVVDRFCDRQRANGWDCTLGEVYQSRIVTLEADGMSQTSLIVYKGDRILAVIPLQ